jgi:hypothetical protein
MPVSSHSLASVTGVVFLAVPVPPYGVYCILYILLIYQCDYLLESSACYDAIHSPFTYQLPLIVYTL